MSLLAWYPLIANGNNQGLDGVNLETIGTIPYTAGKLGNAATFSANLANYYRRAQIKIYNNFSFACWYKLNSTDSTTWQTLFFEGRDVNSDGWGFRINGSNKRIGFCCGNVGWYYGTDLAIGQWHHVCMTIKDSVWTAYVNGSQVGSGTVDTLPALTEWGTYLYIGCLSGSYYPLNGQVQDVRVYDHPLSAREVKELAKGLCMHIPLDWGGNPNIIPDSPVATNPTEVNSELGRTVYVRSTTATGESYLWSGRSSVVSQSTQYTFSAWYWVNEYVKSVELFWLSTNTTNKKTGTNYDNVTNKTSWTPTPNQWHYVTWTFTTKSDDYTGVIRWDNNGSTTSGTAAILKVYNMKLEKGSKATPFVPNSDDSIYTSYGYGSKFSEDCSGYNRTVTVNSNDTIGIATDSPRGTGTNITKNGKLTISNCIPVGTFPMFTVNAWIRTKSDTTYSLWYDFFGISATTNTDSSSLFRMEISNTAGTAFNWFGPMADSAGLFNKTISTNTWYMITLVSDGTKFIGYLNGVQYATKTPDTDARKGWKTTGDFYVGDTNIWFDVADVRVYSTVLSADDIKSLYQTGASIAKNGAFMTGQLVEE